MVQLKVNDELVSVFFLSLCLIHVTEVSIVVEILYSLAKNDPKHA